jgi:adenosylhomocysteine nucleosidase
LGSSLRVGFVVGLSAEARIAARSGYMVRAGGGTPAGAMQAAEALLEQGATALVSFGLAGGLDPLLRPGTLIVPGTVLHHDQCFTADAALGEWFGGQTRHVLLAALAVISTPAEKRALHERTGAHAVDLESGAVAQIAHRHGVPFAVVRAICDPAERGLPPLALEALDAEGRLLPLRVIRSLARRPRQIRTLMALAQDAGCARKPLVGVIANLAGDRAVLVPPGHGRA